MQAEGDANPDGPAPQETVLLVDLPDLPKADALLAGAVPHHARFSALGPAMIARIRPDRVVCPLLARDFDASLLAQRLAGWGYRGRLTVIAPRLPDRAMVQREVAAAAPLLKVEVVTP